jgi:AGZA family xanthine/uracil permease-like MFS transporter
MNSLIARLFRLSENNSTVRTEVLAGSTTFMTMAYIIFVQPAVLSQAGMDFDAVMVATCLSAALATIMMGLLANYPIALAPGMGQNFFFTFTVVLASGVHWQTALGIVFISGVLFLLLNLFRLRQLLIDAIPDSGITIPWSELSSAAISIRTPWWGASNCTNMPQER